ncbi:C13 family peptidase [Microbulbifer donghaiensis]|nr:C13 family peptidase [Microbulbifer donghaiensis]
MKPAAVSRPLILPALLWILTGCEPVQSAENTTLPDGSVYSGSFKNGLFHGQGSLRWPDGRHYQGEFARGRMAGRGRFDYGDGCVYEGEFLDGQLSGHGRYACAEGVWEGEFQRGDLLKGSVAWTEAGSYEGEFLDLMPHGQGHQVTTEGAHYEGTFADGYIVQGSYRDGQGYRYRGGFEYSVYAGAGELTQPDGTIIRANFEYGEANGEGVLIHKDDNGKAIEEAGFFVAGRYYPSKQAWRGNEKQQKAAVEARLYSEAERLQSTLATLAPQRPGVRDVYLLVVGGDGTSPVFAKEVDWVSTRLGSVFDIAQRQIRLSNGSGDKLPLATRTSVRESLTALDALMDPQEDLLLVHFVSHGDKDGDLLLKENKLPLNDISVKDGKQWLDGLRAQHQWLIVSACYSGQWKEALAAPNRVVFTSAAPDRTSFGCSDDSERTWFSAALYGDALGKGLSDPAAWFTAANQRVTAMEKEQGIEEQSHSLPQYAVGQEFLRWWAQAFSR